MPGERVEDVTLEKSKTLKAAEDRSGPRPNSRRDVSDVVPSTREDVPPIVDPAAVTRTGPVAVTRARAEQLARGGAALFESGDMVDHFEVKHLLGEGGMGAVYLALDTKLGRRVALKVVQPEFLGSAKAVESFLFEARMTARFNHPHIITIYAVGEFAGRPYVALEYLEGETLQEILRRRRLTLEEALSVGVATAEALAEAHSHDVLHRDLKPANVLIPADGRLRVLDFGLAKRVQQGDAPPSSRLVTFGPRDYTWAGAGTPAYMAPEQWRADASTVAADVWALGVMLFELVAGKRPFDEESLEDQELIVTGSAVAPRLTAFADIPDELADVVERCLAKDPSQRPTAVEIAELLRALSGSERTPRITIPMSGRTSSAPSSDGSSTAPTVLVGSVGRAQDTTAPSPDDATQGESAKPAPRRAWVNAIIVVAALVAGGTAVHLLDSDPVAPAVTPNAPVVVNVVTPPTVAPTVDAPPSAVVPSAIPSAISSAPKAVRQLRPFNREEAQVRVDSAARSTPFLCKHLEGPRAYTVLVTFGSHGGVTNVKATHTGDGFSSSAAQHCVQTRFYALAIPAFDGAPETVSIGIAL